MLNLHSLKPKKGTKKRRKVVGRGFGSGHGRFSGRGAKGQKARSGGSIKVGFEGGRMPLHRQIPKKRGFTSRRQRALGLNLDIIAAKFQAGETVSPKMLLDTGLTRSIKQPVKILGKGELTKGLMFEKLPVSESAKAKIEQAGGKVIN